MLEILGVLGEKLDRIVGQEEGDMGAKAAVSNAAGEG
jgi:hypothetical protein